MSEVWFTSDLHLGHAKVAEIRGFSSPGAHDNRIFLQWLEAVQEDDTVWVLGDIAVGKPDYALQFLSELPGTKHLIWGNHDLGHPFSRHAHQAQVLYRRAFASAAQSARRRIDGQEVLLSHFPYERDRSGEPPRYDQWRLKDMGVPLLHGHTHGTERLTVTEEAPWWRTEVHVGLDAWDLAPVNLEVVADLLRSAP